MKRPASLQSCLVAGPSNALSEPSYSLPTEWRRMATSTRRSRSDLWGYPLHGALTASFTLRVGRVAYRPRW